MEGFQERGIVMSGKYKASVLIGEGGNDTGSLHDVREV